MDFSYLREVLPQYVAATWQTLQLSLWGVALSLVFGLLVCIAVVYRLPFFAPVCRAYIELSRNTPLLVQLFSCITACRSSASAFPVLPAA